MYSRDGLSLWNLFCFVLGMLCMVAGVSLVWGKVEGYVLLYGGLCIVLANIVDFMVRRDRQKRGFVGFGQGLRFSIMRVFIALMSVALGFLVAVWLDAQESVVVLLFTLAFWFMLLVVGCAIIRGETSGREDP